jgi:hypothetical protein
MLEFYARPEWRVSTLFISSRTLALDAIIPNFVEHSIMISSVCGTGVLMFWGENGSGSKLKEVKMRVYRSFWQQVWVGRAC